MVTNVTVIELIWQKVFIYLFFLRFLKVNMEIPSKSQKTEHVLLKFGNRALPYPIQYFLTVFENIIRYICRYQGFNY